jgi:hypothetical protein
MASHNCYWPDGSSAVSDRGIATPCSLDGDSGCCYDGDACLSNGLCFAPSGGQVSINILSSIYISRSLRPISSHTVVAVQTEPGKRARVRQRVYLVNTTHPSVCGIHFKLLTARPYRNSTWLRTTLALQRQCARRMGLVVW